MRLLFVLPAAAFLAVLGLFPMLQLVRMAFSKVTVGTLHKTWVFAGFSNFAAGFSTGVTQQAMLRTLVFVIVVTILGMVIGFAAAVSLRTKGRWSAIVLAVMVFVWALPPVVIGSVWKFLFSSNGLINTILLGTHLVHVAIPFLANQYWALASLAFVNSFAVIPFNTLVFRAALMNIPPDVFEAAQIDGATRWKQIRYVMIPMARPTGLVLLVLTLVYGFRSFDFIYVMTYGGPGTATNTLPFLGYLQAFVRYDFGQGASTSVMTIAGVIVLAVVYARSIRREEDES